jgi:hypothetical protein
MVKNKGSWLLSRTLQQRQVSGMPICIHREHVKSHERARQLWELVHELSGVDSGWNVAASIEVQLGEEGRRSGYAMHQAIRNGKAKFLSDPIADQLVRNDEPCRSVLYALTNRRLIDPAD